MKDLKRSTRPVNSPSVRSVSLQIRGYQVTVKVKSAVPQIPSPKPVRPSFRWSWADGSRPSPARRARRRRRSFN